MCLTRRALASQRSASDELYMQSTKWRPGDLFSKNIMTVMLRSLLSTILWTTFNHTTLNAHFCLVLRTKVRIWQAGGHVEHEVVVELAHLVGDIYVLAASFNDYLVTHEIRGAERGGGVRLLRDCRLYHGNELQNP